MKEKSFFLTCLFIFFTAFSVPAHADEREYIIGKGDTLSVRVWGEESLSAETSVRPDGMISLPGIGSLQAHGLTTEELQKQISSKLSRLVRDPMVSVMVHASSNNNLIIHGPGVRSSVMALTGNTTLLHVLSQVAPDSNADLANAYVERDGKRILNDFSGLFKDGQSEDNIELKPGDRIYIPLRMERLVYVEGAVLKPSSIVHYDGMTVLEAIHNAGGFTKFANPNKTSVLRKGANGTETITLKLSDLLEDGDLSQNILLQGGDVVVVKKSWF